MFVKRTGPPVVFSTIRMPLLCLGEGEMNLSNGCPVRRVFKSRRRWASIASSTFYDLPWKEEGWKTSFLPATVTGIFIVLIF